MDTKQIIITAIHYIKNNWKDIVTILVSFVTVMALIYAIKAIYVAKNIYRKQKNDSEKQKEQTYELQTGKSKLLEFVSSYINIENELMFGFHDLSGDLWTYPEGLRAHFMSRSLSIENVYAHLNYIYAIVDMVENDESRIRHTASKNEITENEYNTFGYMNIISNNESNENAEAIAVNYEVIEDANVTYVFSTPTLTSTATTVSSSVVATSILDRYMNTVSSAASCVYEPLPIEINEIVFFDNDIRNEIQARCFLNEFKIWHKKDNVKKLAFCIRKEILKRIEEATQKEIEDVYNLDVRCRTTEGYEIRPFNYLNKRHGNPSVDIPLNEDE